MAQIERNEEKRRYGKRVGEVAPDTSGYIYSQVGGLFADLFPEMVARTDGQRGDLTEIRLTWKPNGDWLVVVKSHTEESGRRVLFTGGNDFIEALCNVESALRRGKWRADKPWSAGKESSSE